MTKKELYENILEIVEVYVEKTEAWEEAQVVVDTLTGEVNLMEIEETDELPDDSIVIPAMDLIEMTSDGEWIPDPDSIAEVAADILSD